MNACPRKRKAPLTRYARKTLLRVAFHEASHAVVAYLKGISLRSIRAGHTPLRDGTLGEIQFKSGRYPASLFDDYRRAREYVSDDILLTLAGPVGESIYLRTWVELPMDEGDDESTAYALSELIYDQRKSQFDFVNRCRFQALQILLQPDVWAAVEALASVLMVRRKLTGEQACRIIRDALAKARSRAA
jgi:hypothetical protein